MNKKILVLTSALLLPMGAFAVSGEDIPDAHHHRRLENLSKDLQLNEEQKTKLETIFKEQHEKFRAIHEESHQRIKELLTPEQIGKWEELQKQRQEGRKMRGKGRQAKPE